MKIVLFRGLSRYGALCRFIDAIAEGCRARGHEPIILEPHHFSHGWDDIVALLPTLKPIGMAYAFMVAGDFRTADGRTLTDLMDAPLVVHYVDYPLSHGERFLNTDRRTRILTVDKSHAGAVRNALGPDRFAHISFCPHGGHAPRTPYTPNSTYEQRPIQALFCGSYYAPGTPPWQTFPEEFRGVFADAAEIALSEEWLPPHQALERAFVLRGINLQEVYPPEGCRTIRILAAHVHEWVRQTRRARFLAAAAKVQLPLTLCGEGYENAPHYDGFTMHGPASYDDTLQMMAQAKLVVSVNANFGEGSHERVFNAMLAGAAAASDTSAYYRENFSQKEIFQWRWQHLEEDLRALREQLASGQMAQQAAAGWHTATASHSWQHRVVQILTTARIPS